MIHEKITFDNETDDVYMDTYIADKVGDFKRKAIIVLPGGGYCHICADREGEPIAMAFMPYGYNAFVLHYSVSLKKKFPAQLIELSAAVKHIKDNAEKYNIDDKEIFVVGFSAGGHLAASLATMWHKKEIYNKIDMPFGYNKPKGVMLIYPLVTAFDSGSPFVCFERMMCGEKPSEEFLIQCSIENNVDKQTVPAFIMHTANDETVNVRSSLILANAYTNNNIPYEMHIYPDAPHGIALGNKITECGNKKHNNPHIADWVRLAAEWADGFNAEC